MSFQQKVDPSNHSDVTYRIALLGAESSGKTTLAVELTAALCEMGYNAGLVPEFLRTWCEQNSRLPNFEDQEIILEGQLALEDAAATRFDIVVCDPAAITTGFYSLEYFGSDLHMEWDLLKRYDQLFLCDIDFPWQADPLRESPVARAQMHTTIKLYVQENEGRFTGNIPLLTGSTRERLIFALAQLDLPEILP